MTTAFASGPWARVHRRCHQRDGKTQNKNSPWPGGYPQRPGYHVKRFNRTLAERLFEHKYAVEMRLPKGPKIFSMGRSASWCDFALNGEVTWLIRKKPAEAITENSVYSKPATSYHRPVGVGGKSSPPLCTCVNSTNQTSGKATANVKMIPFGH